MTSFLRRCRDLGLAAAVMLQPLFLLGVRLYKNLSDVNFRRVTFILLGISGIGLLLKAADTFPSVAHAMKMAHL